MLLVSVISNLLLFTYHVTGEDCLNQVFFGSKTPYSFMENDGLNVTYPDHCMPIQINMVHRHGNRYPSIKDVKKMDNVLFKLNKAYEENEYDKNQQGDLKFPIKNMFAKKTDKLLSHVGVQELYDIGKRLTKRFPNLFEKNYFPLIYKFQSSCKLRCTHSANALAAGIFENKGSLRTNKVEPVAIEVFPCSDDPVLRFFEMCDKYRIKVDDNPAALKEAHDFAHSKEIKRVIKNVISKLEFDNLTLDPVDVQALYLMCAYEIGMFDGKFSTGLCSLLNEEDRRILEFWYDLKHFYKRSAGYPITYHSSCPLLRDMYNSLKKVVEDPKNFHSGVFRSAHAETIMPLFALLGIYLDDEKITASNYEHMKYRKFRSACISPFSGNLYFILYKCESNTYKIQLYVNEKLHKLPCCDNEIECDFEKFLQYYEEQVNSCNMNYLCKLQKTEL